MSSLTKGFVVFQALLVFMYLGVTSTLYQHRQDWRQSYEQLKERYAEAERKETSAITVLRQTEKNRRQDIALKVDEIDDLAKETERAKLDYASKGNDLSRKKREFDILQEQATKLTTTNDTLNGTLQRSRDRRTELQQNLENNLKRRALADAQVARLNALTLNLETDLRDLTREYSGVRNDLRDKSLLVAMAEERGVNFATLLGGPPAKLVRGRVAVVKADMSPPLIVVDIGDDDGVEIGYELSVYRGKSFVAKVHVERVEAGNAACRIEFVAEGQSIQPGDNVTTRLP